MLWVRKTWQIPSIPFMFGLHERTRRGILCWVDLIWCSLMMELVVTQGLKVCNFLSITMCILMLWLGYRVSQVHFIFSIPEKAATSLFGSDSAAVPEHLAYVEWFSPFTSPEPNHLMYQINHSMSHGKRVASMIPVSAIWRSIHLFPKFGPVAPQEWSSSNVLEHCNSFYVSCWTDQHAYITVF